MTKVPLAEARCGRPEVDFSTPTMSGMVKRSAGKQMGLFRTLAREEQKKLQALKAGDGDAKAIAESEKRLRQLTEKMAKLGNTPDATAEEEAEASQQARRESHVRRQAEVHLSDNMTEEELKAWRQRREDENVAAGAPKNSRKLEETMGACSVCYVPTSKKTLTGVTTSYFCSPKCQPVCKSNLQPHFNVRVFECFDTSTSAVLREPAESDRFVQKSAESTSI